MTGTVSVSQSSLCLSNKNIHPQLQLNLHEILLPAKQSIFSIPTLFWIQQFKAWVDNNRRMRQNQFGIQTTGRTIITSCLSLKNISLE